MKTFKKLTFVLVSTIGSLTINAQQDPMYTHYMDNTLVINPGYAGSRDALTVTALHRSQWVDYKGAPITQTIMFHTPLRNEHLGVGMSVMNDKIGLNFFDYINSLRVEEAKRLLIETSKKEMNVIEIAYSVGFNNKVSFNNTFKKWTGMTPTEFRASEKGKTLSEFTD